MKYTCVLRLANLVQTVSFRVIILKGPSLSRGEIFIHIHKLNVLGSIQSNLVAHELYARRVPLPYTITTRLTAVSLCHVRMEL